MQLNLDPPPPCRSPPHLCRRRPAEGLLTLADEAERRCDFKAAATFLESARCPPYAAKLLLLAEARAWAACGEGTGMATIWVGWGRGWRHGRDGLSVL